MDGERHLLRLQARTCPAEADLVFDVRFLPNPYYVAELRPLHRPGRRGDGTTCFPAASSQEFLEKLHGLWWAFSCPGMWRRGRRHW